MSKNEMNIESPYPGLRSFQEHESKIFYGRQNAVADLLNRLASNNFIAVVGASGCGKSSLVRAGLIPLLKAGYLVNKRDRWLILTLRPGEAPLHNLAIALLPELQQDDPALNLQVLVQKIKAGGAFAIIELLQKKLSDNQTNVFILVDQFEELLFRFSLETDDGAEKGEASHFVNILLYLSRRSSLPVFVVMTMRSDFIGNCSQFYGLPEALNQGQYLVPRFTRVQLKNAIEGPVHWFGAKIDPLFTSRLLNDMQTVKNELPLLQHLLMRTWDFKIKSGKSGELGIEDYKAVGGIEKALSLCADQALARLNEGESETVRLMFQALTTTDQDGRKMRRPAYLSELVKITGASKHTITDIINHFNEDKVSFFVVNESAGVDDPLIDIFHESLIRQWSRLSHWIDEETENVKTYFRLCEEVELYKKQMGGLMRGAKLQLILNWRTKTNSNAAWAGRYNNSFEEAMQYLHMSKIEETMEYLHMSKTGGKSPNKIPLKPPVNVPNNKIFVSYRRKDSFDITDRICEQLFGHFGKDKIIYDIETIPYGENFRSFINNKMNECGIVLVIIGNSWLNIEETEGPNTIRRIDSSADTVRAEIEIAFKLKKTLIPILTGGATMPEKGELPESIKQLSDLNAAKINSGAEFHLHINKIILQIEKTIGPVNKYFRWLKKFNS